MTVEQIVTELQNLTVDELRQVKAKLEHQLEIQHGESVHDVLREFAGKAEGLPEDMAENHDHYLYGLPKDS